MANSDLKFLKDAIKDIKTGKRHKVQYSQGGYTKQSGLPEKTISIYAKGYGALPKGLNPINNTDSRIDYFETDTIRIRPSNKHYKDVLGALKKKEAFNQKMDAKRTAKLMRGII